MNQQSPLTGKVPLRVDVSEQFAAQLRAVAQAEHRTVSGLVRDRLVKALQRQPSAEQDGP